MKKITLVAAAALTLCAAVTLSACGGQVNLKAETSPNWNAVVSSGDLYEGSEWLTRKETAKYGVTFVKGANSAYSVSYVTDGSKEAGFTTELYATEYDWNSSSVPEKYRTEGTEYVYVYKTSLTLFGTYTLASTKETKDFEQSVLCETYMRSASGNLQPVYSQKTIKTCAPNSVTPTTISSVYAEMDCVYKTYYKKDCSEATVYLTDNLSPDESGEKVIEGLNDGYSLFDASSLGMVMRSFSSNAGNNLFGVLEPINGVKSQYSATGAAAGELKEDDEEQKKLIGALENSTPADYIFVGDKKYPYNSVTLSLNAAMSGPSYVYWYSAVKDKNFNATRAVMLKVTENLPFFLGSLNFTLETLNYTDI